MNEREVFLAALEIKDEGERRRFLEECCPNDESARKRLQEFLDIAGRVGGFLEEPAIQPTSAMGRVPGDDRPDMVIAGRYKLREKLGEGGMGSVWIADQSEPVQRKVAVKLIKTGVDSRGVLARFEQERQALALMDHPNIAKIFDAGVDQRPYFVMELIKGVPITNYCDDAKLSPQERLELFVQVCHAVQHAHQKGIIHRDLKPGNILVGLYDGKPIPKVIDFGVAKATGSRLTDQSIYTEVGSLVGTLEYMSPEQAEPNNLDIDTRSDVYSLGIVLYELLTGSVPFSRKELAKAGFMGMLRAIKEIEPLKPSTKLSGSDALPSVAANRHTQPALLTRLVKGELDWIVMKALEKDRGRRYESASGLAADVRHYLYGEPVSAAPPSAAYRLKKFVSRNRPTVVAAVLVFAALLTGMTGTTWGLMEARKSAAAERDAKRDADVQRDAALESANAEKAANQKAQKRLAQIERGVELLASLLKGLNPQGEEAGAPPLYEQLRQRAVAAADGLIGEAVSDPAAMERLQTLMGETLHELGEYKKAAELMERVRASQQIRFRSDAPEILATISELASAYLLAGDSTKALEHFKHVRDVRTKDFGPNHLETLKALHDLAGAYKAVGRPKDAVDCCKMSFDGLLKLQGPEDPITLITETDLATAYLQVDRKSDAIDLLENVKKIQMKHLPPAHPAILTTLNNLGMAYHAAGQPKQAVAVLQDLLDVYASKFGPNHPSSFAVQHNLALAYRDAGEPAKAIELLKSLREAIGKKLGADHHSLLTTSGTLAKAYAAVGQFNESLLLLDDSATAVEQRGFQYEYAPDVFRATISAFEKAQQFCRAECWRRKWIAEVKRRDGPDSRAYADELAGLGSNLLQQRKWRDAQATLNEELEIRRKRQPDDWATFNACSQLGAALLGRKRYAEAEPLLIESYQGMKQREKTIPPAAKARMIETLNRLIRCSESLGPQNRAKDWKKEREALGAKSS